MENGMALDEGVEDKHTLLGDSKSKLLGEMKNQFVSSSGGCSSSENDLMIDEDEADAPPTDSSNESNSEEKPALVLSIRKPQTRSNVSASMDAPKRSTRRRSKDCNESVLQSAIARKEKSYNETYRPQRLSRQLKPTQKILDNIASAAAKKDRRRKVVGLGLNGGGGGGHGERRRRHDLDLDTKCRRSGRLSIMQHSESDESDTAKGLQEDTEVEMDVEPAEEHNFSSHLDADSATAQLIASRLCVCTSPTKYTPISELNVHCNAMDSISNRLIGCNNAVDRESAWMLRPSTRVPYMVLCALHRQRLRDHHCCAMCGIFCTQGAFLQCARKHLYHPQCKLAVGRDLECCPHCGATDKHVNVTITMECTTLPVYTRTQCTEIDTPAKSTNSPLVKHELKQSAVKSPRDSGETVHVHDDEDVDVEALPEDAFYEDDFESRAPSIICDEQIMDLQKMEDIGMQFNGKLDGDIKEGKKLQRNIESLLAAISKGLYAEVATLLGEVDAEELLEMVDVDGIKGTVLHYAAKHGLVPIMHMLKIADMDMDAVDSQNCTSLMAAIDANQHEAVKYLATAGASITAKGTDGMTALHMACKCGNLTAAKQLLVTAAHIKGYIDCADDGGWTPLVWACEHSHVDVVKHLLSEGADPQLADVEGNVALHWAAFSGSITITELIINYGARLDVVNEQGDTALHVAARQDNHDCITLLVTRGAKLDIRNESNETALDCAPPDSKSHQILKVNTKLKTLISKK